MLTAVQLYHQTALKAHKINDVWADGVLAFEMVSAKSVDAIEDFPEKMPESTWVPDSTLWTVRADGDIHLFSLSASVKF